MTQDQPIRLLVHGASGRMGRAVVRLAAADPRFAVVAAVSRGGESIEGAPGVANFSLGVAVLEDLVRRVSAALPDWPLTLVETHHVRKLDAPSGTALMLARAAQAITGRAPAIESLREGDVVGIHRLQFGGPGETLELGHVAGDRDLFARGALQAAALVAGRGPGAYRLGELLLG